MSLSMIASPSKFARTFGALAEGADASASRDPVGERGMLRFSTRSICPARRLEYWNDLAVRTLGPMTFDARNPRAFDAEMVALPLGEADLLCSWSGPFRLECRPGAVSSQAPGTLNLGVHLGGVSSSRQEHRTWLMRPGDLMLVDPARRFDLSAEGVSHMLTLRLPRNRVIERLGDIDRHVGVRVSGSEGPGAALSSLIRGLWPAATRTGSQGWAGELVEIVLRLLELILKLDRRDEEEQASTFDVRRAQLQVFIERHLHDPGLGTPSIAASLGITPRYVQQLFAPLGMTPSAYILERRLQHAAAEMRRDRRRRLCDIAYEVGFTDLSYFCRTFRRYFGQTPGHYRRQSAS